MVVADSIFVSLERMVDCLPMPPAPVRRQRGRHKTYSDRLILKALMIMIVRRLDTAWALLAFLQQSVFAMGADLWVTGGDRQDRFRIYHCRLVVACGRVLARMVLV